MFHSQAFKNFCWFLLLFIMAEAAAAAHGRRSNLKHKTKDAPVHQHSAYQAWELLPDGELKTEIGDYLCDVKHYDPLQSSIPCTSNPHLTCTDSCLLEGASDEDEDDPQEICNVIPTYHHARWWRHGWDPDGGLEDGFLYCDSAYETAEQYWLEALSEYKNGNHGRAYWLLGRVVHLLTDIGVPAHVLKDIHPDVGGVNDDSFEEYMQRDHPDWDNFPESPGAECEPDDIAAGDCNYQHFYVSDGLYYALDESPQAVVATDARSIDPDTSWNDSWGSVYADHPDTPDTAFFRLFLIQAEWADEYESDGEAGESPDHDDGFLDVRNDHLRWHGIDLMGQNFEHIAGLYELFGDWRHHGIVEIDSNLRQHTAGEISVKVRAWDSAVYRIEVEGFPAGWSMQNESSDRILLEGDEADFFLSATPDDESARFFFRLLRKGPHGNFQVVEELSWGLEVSGPDLDPPTIVDHEPSINAVFQSGETIEIGFSEEMDTQTFTGSRIHVVGALQGAYGTILLETNDDELRIRPVPDLIEGDTVTVTIDPTVTDASGNGIDGDGDVGPAYEWTFHVSPLNAPSNLQAVALSASAVQLSWDDRSDDEDSFVLSRAPLGGASTILDILPADQETYLDESVSLGDWIYEIYAVNSIGHSAIDSSSVTVIDVALPPDPPFGLSAQPLSDSEIRLSWADLPENASGLKIERRDPGLSWFQIKTLSASTTQYVNHSLSSNTTYEYRIRAYNPAGDSSPSTVVEATTLSNAPQAPTNLVAWAISDSKIGLSWRDRSSNEDRFRIERRVSGGSWSAVGTTGRNDATYDDQPVSANTSYSYRVRAENSDGGSEYSNIADVVSCIAPDPPRLDEPHNGEDELPTDLDLIWDFDDEVAHYDLYWGSTSPPQNEVLGIPSPASGDPSYPLTGLDPSTTYYWRVVAHALCDPSRTTSSNIESFSTIGPPGTVDLLSPADGATDQPTGLVLDWANVATDGGTLYEVCYGAENPPPTCVDTGTVTELLVTSLSANTTYFWHVTARAADAPDLTSVSETWNFTTGDGVVVETQTIYASKDAGLRGGSHSGKNYGGVVGGSNEQRGFGIGNGRQIFTDFQSAPVRGAVQFDLSTIPVGAIISNATLVFEIFITTGTQTSPLTLYFDPFTGAWQENTVTWANRPGVDLSERITGEFPLSGWNPLRNSLTDLVTAWHAGELANHGFMVSAPDWESVQNHAKFFFQREANDSGSLGPRLEVTYSLPCGPPAAPQNPQPVDGAVDQGAGTVLDWDDVPNASGYRVFFGTSPDPPEIGLASESQIAVAAPSASTTWYWRIEALAACDPDLVSTSPVWSFTTAACLPPSAPSTVSPAPGAVNQPRDVLLDWESSAGSGSYRVFLGETNPPTTWVTTVSETSQWVSVAPETNYFWQIVAVSDCDPALIAAGVVEEFTTADAPEADAGLDRDVTVFETTVLGGAEVASGGTPPYSYSWSLSPAVGASLSDPNAATPTFEASVIGSYTAHLVVTDASQFVAGDEVRILVEAIDYPKVSWVHTVAPTSDDRLDFGEQTDAALTQLIVAYDMEVFGADDPDSYRLIAAGEDDVVQTESCDSAPDVSDFVVQPTEVIWNSETYQAALRIDDPLPVGGYRLLACASVLSDGGGDPLDGNGDGTGGDDFVQDFRVLSNPLLANPNFDVGIDSWISIPESAAHSPRDADGAETSGSAVMTDLTGTNTLHSLSQCVVLSPGRYLLSAKASISSGTASGPSVRGLVDFFSGAACDGAVLATGATPARIGDTQGLWVDDLVLNIAAPVGTNSAMVTFLAGPSSLGFVVELDEASLRDTLIIFVDGFESGDFSSWSTP